ncbi:MAG: AraC family transcriptional regulator [Lachnospiraceae bacterium]|nr:AraC family transcriptional regulator [Lachnospiraceae bacterium]
MNKVYAAGYSSTHPADFVYDTPPGRFLLVMTHSPAVFRCGEALVQFPEDTAILYEPGENLYYRADGESYSDDWLYFSTTEKMILDFPCRNRPFPISEPEYCYNLQQLITWEYYSDKEGNEEILSDLVQILFSRLYDDSNVREVTSFSHALYALRKSIQMEPWREWSVKGMAERLNISSSYLQALYKQQFGISCMEDVINNRIKRARHQLAHTRKSSAEIALDCGYHTVEHFNRQFRKITGMSPLEYRKKVSAEEPQWPPELQNSPSSARMGSSPSLRT